MTGQHAHMQANRDWLSSVAQCWITDCALRLLSRNVTPMHNIFFQIKGLRCMGKPVLATGASLAYGPRLAQCVLLASRMCKQFWPQQAGHGDYMGFATLAA